jgi:hypothetical protein
MGVASVFIEPGKNGWNFIFDGRGVERGHPDQIE